MKIDFGVFVHVYFLKEVLVMGSSFEESPDAEVFLVAMTLLASMSIITFLASSCVIVAHELAEHVEVDSLRGLRLESDAGGKDHRCSDSLHLVLGEFCVLFLIRKY